MVMFKCDGSSYPKMNIIKLLLILITRTIHFSEQIKHVNESSSIDVCIGNDVDLLWKVDEEEKKISKFEWYFNNKMICISSPVETFTVKPPYQGRIERINKTEIRLKNVSIDDEGMYILFPLLAWSTSQNMQKIVLRILEPPTNSCTCKMGHPPDFTYEQTESYCGRPQVSLVWKRKQTFEVLGEGNRILNSTLQDKEVLCCLDGEAMKCVDKRQVCTTVSIPDRDTERPSEDGNAERTDSVTMPGTSTGSTNIHHMQPFVLAALIALALFALLGWALFIRKCKKRKNNTDVVAVEPTHSSTDVQFNENLQQFPTVAATTVAVEPTHSSTDVQFNEDLQQFRTLAATTVAVEPTHSSTDVQFNENLQQFRSVAATTVAVQPTHSSTDVQFNENLQQFRTLAATTDWPLQDSNQRVQNVNNISIYTDFFKNILRSNPSLKAELQAGTKDRPLPDTNQRVQNVSNIVIDTNVLKSILRSNPTLMAELQAGRKDWPFPDTNQRVQNVSNIIIDTNVLKSILRSNPTLMAELQVGTKDWPLQDSNQRVQNVNNISKYTDFHKSTLRSNPSLKAELQAGTKETNKLKRQLHREKRLRKKEHGLKYSFEMTPGKCRYFKKNDTDTVKTSECEDASSDDTDTFKTSKWEDASSDDTDLSETSEWEDASSETRKLKRQHHPEKHLRKKENRPKYSYKMTPVKCRYFKKNDTDTFKTSVWEDASSEPPSTTKLL